MRLSKTADMSLSDATKPLLVVSRLVGINPKSHWHKIYTALVLACDLLLLFEAWRYHTGRTFPNYYFHLLVHAMQDMCCIAAIFVILGLSLFDRRRFMIPLREFVNVDKSLTSLGACIDNRRTYRLEVLQLICVGLYSISFGLSEYILRISPVDNKQLYAILLMGLWYYLIVLIECFIVDCSFSVTLSVIKQRFKEINSIICRVETHEFYSRLIVTEVSRAHNDKDVLRVLKILRSQYHILWGIANRSNDAYGLHLLVGITSSLALITSKLYETYNRFSNSDDDLRLAAVSSLNWALCFVGRIFALAYVCESTVAEAKATSAALQELRMKRDHSSATKEEIRDFLTQLQFEVKNFTAYKFFDITFSLVCGIIGAACTYLVILIQMGDSSPDYKINGNSNESLYFGSEDNPSMETLSPIVNRSYI